MLGSNGTTAGDFSSPRYQYDFVIKRDSFDLLTIVEYCVRDMETFNGDIVFQHESKDVCRKMEKLLNEG